MRLLLHRRPALHLALCMASLASVFSTGCASPQLLATPPALLADALFEPVAPRFDPQTLFALDEPMQAYLRQRLPQVRPGSDSRRALLEALFDKSELKLRYDGGQTRTAAEAFAARAGNCLSLVIMTAAFAKHLDLPVRYRSVAVADTYSRTGELYMLSGHVNLSLGPPPTRATSSTDSGAWLTVDFLPQEDLGRQRVTTLPEATIVAMYLNNRAAEALSEGRIDLAYHWAREALLQDPYFSTAANTLAVIYQRADHIAQAEAALRHVLAAEPDHTPALANLAGLLTRAGRHAEAAGVTQTLARLQPVAPFHHFNLGRRAMAAGDYAAARDYFGEELQRQPYQDEVHFWLAQAHWRLGNADLASRHLQLAAEHSMTATSLERYTSKLALLRGAAQTH